MCKAEEVILNEESAPDEAKLRIMETRKRQFANRKKRLKAMNNNANMTSLPTEDNEDDLLSDLRISECSSLHILNRYSSNFIFRFKSKHVLFKQIFVFSSRRISE